MLRFLYALLLVALWTPVAQAQSYGGPNYIYSTYGFTPGLKPGDDIQVVEGFFSPGEFGFTPGFYSLYVRATAIASANAELYSWVHDGDCFSLPVICQSYDYGITQSGGWSGWYVLSFIIGETPKASIVGTPGQAGYAYTYYEAVGGMFRLTFDSPDPVWYSVDIVFYEAVPEASTWAMLIGGFGLAGGALRRRTAKVSVAYG